MRSPHQLLLSIMPQGSGSEKRAHAIAKRCARLRKVGMPLQAIADLVGIHKDQVSARIKLGERPVRLVRRIPIIR